LIWLRAFHSDYNPALAARVVALLKRDFPEIHLTMVGPDKRDGSLQEFQRVVQALDTVEQIEWIGRVPKSDVPLWLQKGDIFLNTTYVDNTPISVMEAMASGLCIVSTNVGGIPYLLEHERDALLVPPDDPDAMSSAVHRVLTEPGLAGRLSHNARTKAEQFDWSQVLPQWDSTLKAVVKKHSIRKDSATSLA
jgi:glycosyltransferase involved in cell wall biosynthesis